MYRRHEKLADSVLGMAYAPETLRTDSKTMSCDVVVSTEIEDHSDDIVLVKGIDLSTHRSNPVVLYDHAREGGIRYPIGKAESPDGAYTVKLDGNRLVATTYFTTAIPEAEQCFRLIEDGVLNGASIGFKPLEAQWLPLKPETLKQDGGIFFKRVRLLEYSHTALPDNPECVVMGLGKPYLKSALLRKSLEQFAPERRVQIAVPAGVPVEPKPELTSAAERKTMADTVNKGAARKAKSSDEDYIPLNDPSETENLDETLPANPAAETAPPGDTSPPMAEDKKTLDDVTGDLQAKTLDDVTGDLQAKGSEDEFSDDRYKDAMPGARCLASLHDHYTTMAVHLSDQLAMQENPAIRDHLETEAADLEDRMQRNSKLFSKQYPDLDPLDTKGALDDEADLNPDEWDADKSRKSRNWQAILARPEATALCRRVERIRKGWAAASKKRLSQSAAGAVRRVVTALTKAVQAGKVSKALLTEQLRVLWRLAADPTGDPVEVQQARDRLEKAERDTLALQRKLRAALNGH